MANVKAKWAKSPSLDTVSYELSWKKDGIVASTVTIPRNSTKDAIGYESTWLESNGEVSLGDGNVVTCDIRAIDGDGNKSEPLALTFTIPIEPPLPPPSGTLTLV
jgi:hypothetical protein